MSTTDNQTDPTTSVVGFHKPVPSDEDLEDVQAALRQLLGVRPAEYREEDPHPDQRPCPKWCYLATGELQHELDPSRPRSAEHHYDVRAATVASLYPGRSWRVGDSRRVDAATVEGHLSQLGQLSPVITLNLRHSADDQNDYVYAQLVRLTVLDAQELVTALNHLIGVATGAVEPVK